MAHVQFIVLDIASQLLRHCPLAAFGTAQNVVPCCFRNAIEQPMGSRTQHSERQQRCVHVVYA
jgi:hypothetical protein